MPAAAHGLLDLVGTGTLPSHLVWRRRAFSALAPPLASFLLAAWMLSACVPDYRPPNYNEPHALVKVRLAYRAWSGPELEQLVTVDGHDIRDIPLPVQHGGGVATRSVLVRPGSTGWTIQTTFFHNDVTTHAETFDNTEAAPCGSTTCMQSTVQARSVNKVERVDDATCTQGLTLLASAGETYILEYEYLANQQCNLHCYQQVHQRKGVLTNVPCADPAGTSTPSPSKRSPARAKHASQAQPGSRIGQL
jgi:hypothetical protein